MFATKNSGGISLMKLFCELSIRFVLVSLLLVMVTIYTESLKSACAQFAVNTQVWKDNENNVKILFSHLPDNPIVNTPTQIRFTIDKLMTGAALKNVLVTVIIIGNSSGGQERVIKFNGLSDSKGSYSVNYTFPDLGMYQVIM